MQEAGSPAEILLRLDLGDRYLIKLTLPIPLCRIGRLPAKGELFKHMNDPSRPHALP